MLSIYARSASWPSSHHESMSEWCATDYRLYIYESSSRLGDYKNGFNWILKSDNKNFGRQTTESTKQNRLKYNISI